MITGAEVSHHPGLEQFVLYTGITSDAGASGRGRGIHARPIGRATAWPLAQTAATGSTTTATFSSPILVRTRVAVLLPR